MKSKCLSGAIAVGIALTCAQIGNAAAIAGAMHEPFGYPAGTLFPNPSTLNGGQGWNTSGLATGNAAGSVWAATGVISGYGGAAANKTNTDPGLTHTATGYLAPTGGKLTMDAATPNASQNMARVLGGQTIDAGTTYFSMLMSKSNDTTRTINVAFFGPAGAAGTPGATTERLGIGMFGTTGGNSGGNIAAVFNNVNPANLVQATTPIALGTNVTHLVIGKVEWNAAGNETFTMWVDPTNVTTEAAAGAAYLSSSGFELTSFTAVRPFVGNNATVGGTPVTGVIGNFDEIRVGGSWASVTTAPVAVPEPSAAALLFLAGLGLARFRGRR